MRVNKEKMASCCFFVTIQLLYICVRNASKSNNFSRKGAKKELHLVSDFPVVLCALCGFARDALLLI